MVYEGAPIGGFTIQEDGSLLLFMDKGGIGIWKDGELTMKVQQLAGEADSRFNDVIADPEGRVFCGTMSSSTHPGALYRLDTDGTIHKVITGVGTSNGMGFTPDRTQMYYTDTRKHTIDLLNYDRKTGALSNRRVFVRIPEDEGGPDGMTVDAEGYVWSARWDGGHVFRYAPDGTLDMQIPFPAKKVSCVTFGGENYEDMYVTTAGGDNKEVEGPGAGALFRVKTGIGGVPEFRSKVQF
jgi:D-xylonolactonase